ncbi:alginate export family protein [Sphingomonas sp. LM7]|uniref:alginate export family protein n=1 Tax=Sphingomonas sp. LM7 TaxID=1938607 RepID=UPI00098392E7|nr:alginate export family protein [Sphingomonas sp. LM7]AQR72725.1 hypothetical protein BXU08_02705 [Sphingomonas sp. LM7]
MRSMLLAGAALATAAPACAQEIKPLAEARVRYEHVEQDGLAQDAEAVTIRVRTGVQASAGHWTALVEAQGNMAVVGDYYDGLHGAATRPLISDPENIALYRAQIQYRSKAVVVTAGRQRIALDDERFVGTSPFRQNAQTFDAVRFELMPLKGLKADLTYAWSVRTIWGVEGNGARQASVGGDNVFATLGYATPVGTLTGFAILVDQDEAAVQGYRLSNQSYGARLAGSQPLSRTVKLTYAGSYARQSDYHRNPNHYSASYYQLDAGLDVAPWRIGATYEVLGASDGRPFTSFQFPVGTAFRYQGNAGKFSPDPPDGVRDLFGTVGFGRSKAGPFRAVTLQAQYHHFESDRLVRHYGDEIDLIASGKLGRTTVALRYADYHADRFATDTQKLWLQLDWTL